MDKVGKPTGAGKIRERIRKQPGLVFATDLYNYNIDGNLIKDEHRDYLKRKIVPLLKRSEHHVKLLGVASKSGDADYNLQLSKERVLRVKQFLIQQGLPESKVPGQEMRAAGEYTSTSAYNEDELDRRVTLVIGKGTKPLPLFRMIIGPIEYTLPKKKKPTPPKTPPSSGSKNWKITHLGTASFGQGHLHLFWIVDKKNKTEVVCRLTSIGMPDVGTPASVVGRGDWKDFSTKKPHDISEFHGKKAVFEMPPGALFWSVSPNVLNIFDLSAGRIPVKSGTTWGASATGTTTFGELMCSEPAPYKPRYWYDPITGEWVLH